MGKAGEVKIIVDGKEHASYGLADDPSAGSAVEVVQGSQCASAKMQIGSGVTPEQAKNLSRLIWGDLPQKTLPFSIFREGVNIQIKVKVTSQEHATIVQSIVTQLSQQALAGLKGSTSLRCQSDMVVGLIGAVLSGKLASGSMIHVSEVMVNGASSIRVNVTSAPIS